MRQRFEKMLYLSGSILFQIRILTPYYGGSIKCIT